MKNKIKKVLCLATLPLTICLSSFTQVFSSNGDNIVLNDNQYAFNNHVKKAGTISPAISFLDNKYTIVKDGVSEEKSIPSETDQNQYIDLANLAVGTQISFSIFSNDETHKGDFFDESGIQIDLKYYSYTLVDGTFKKGNELSYSPIEIIDITTTVVDSIQYQKYNLKINNASDFAFTLASDGNDTYSGFETFSFITNSSKKDQEGITVTLHDEPDVDLKDGDSYSIKYDGVGTLSLKFESKIIGSVFSTGSESFMLSNFKPDDEATKNKATITPSGELTITGSPFNFQLIYAKRGDENYNDLYYAININILSKLDKPEAIFESSGQSNYHNRIYNLKPNCRYSLYYKSAEGYQLQYEFTALDGNGVLSDDVVEDPIFNQCKNKGYVDIDNEHSSTMSGATIMSISQIARKGEESIYSESDRQEISSGSAFILPRKKMPTIYDKDNFPDGIYFDDSNGVLMNVESGYSYEIGYYLPSSTNTILYHIAQISNTETQYDLASYIPQGAVLKSIAVRGTSSSELKQCVASSFQATLAGFSYKHVDSPKNIGKIDFNQSVISAITGLEKNTPYLLYTSSLGSDRKYITITSDSNGSISIMNNELLGGKDAKSGEIAVAGLKIESIRRIGDLQSDDVNERRSNSTKLGINYTFVDIKSYRTSLLKTGVTRVDRLGVQALRQNGRDRLNDKQLHAMTVCKAKIETIDIDNLTLIEIQNKIDEYIDDLALNLNKYVGIMGYLMGIEGWVYIVVAIGLYLVLIATIFMYRSAKKKYERASIKVLQKLASFSPLSIVILYSFNSVGGNLFAPIIIMIEIVFIAIFLALTVSYLRKANDLKRWKKYHDDEGQIIVSALSKKDQKRLEKLEKKKTKTRQVKQSKENKKNKEAKAAE